MTHPEDVIKGTQKSDLEGLRVLMINMPLRETAVPNCAPLGPALLAARLREFGAYVSILDLNAYRVQDAVSIMRGLDNGRHLTPKEARNKIQKNFLVHGEPDLIGISGKITTLRWQVCIAQMMRDLLPAAFIVSGGGLATEFRDGLFRWIPELDAIAHSEGDDVIIKAGLDALSISKHGRESAAIRGDLAPYLQNNSDGIIRLVYAGDRPRDLGKLPLPAWDLLNIDPDGVRVMENYIKNPIWGLEANNSSATPFAMSRSLNTVSSRGCPFDCKFCYRGSQGERNWGVRSAGALTAEVERVYDDYAIDFLGILDDNFLVNAERIAALPKTLGRVCRDHNIAWGTHGRLDEADPGRMGAVRDSGGVYIGFGAESASTSVLQAMGKSGQMLSRGTVNIDGRQLPKAMVDGYKNTIDAGIHGNTTWMMGYPGEKLDDLKDTAAFILWQRGIVGKPEAVNQRLFMATAYPGTELFRDKRVKKRLARGFNIEYDEKGEPIPNRALRDYVLELDDADKVLIDNAGEPVYYGDMPLSDALYIKDLADKGRTTEILSL